MWGVDETVTWAVSTSTANSVSKSSGTLPTGASASMTSNDSQTDKSQLTNGKKQTFTLTGMDGCTIKAVKVNMRKSSNGSSATVKVNVGSTALQSGQTISLSTTAGDKSVTLANTTTVVGESENVVITVTSNKNSAYVLKYIVTYEAATSYTITPASNNTNYGTVSLSNGVITATPKSGYRISTSTPYSVSPANSATVVQGTGANINKFTVTPSANTTVTINFEAIPLCTVTLKDDNSTLPQSSAGASVTLPSRSGCTGYTFAGWSTTNNTSWTTTAPTIISAGNYTPTENINLYPVYTKEDTGNGFTGYTKVTSAPSDWSGQYLISDGDNTADGGNLSNTALSITAFKPGSTEKTEYEFSFVKNGNNNNYYILLPDGETYLGGASSGANFALTTNTNNLTNYYLWTFSTSDPMSTNVGNSRYIGVGVQSSTDCFKAYSTSGTNSKCYLYKRTEGETTITYYISVPNCCTELGSINGSVIVNQTPTSVQLSWNAVDGAEKYQVKVPGSTSHNDWTDATSGVTVTGLACGTAHTAYFRAIDTNGSHCSEGPESTLAIPAQSWTVTSTSVTNVTASPAIPSTTCNGFSTTLTAATGYALPSEITVTNADKTWNSSTGALTISNVTGNVTITRNRFGCRCRSRLSMAEQSR